MLPAALEKSVYNCSNALFSLDQVKLKTAVFLCSTSERPLALVNELFDLCFYLRMHSYYVLSLDFQGIKDTAHSLIKSANTKDSVAVVTCVRQWKHRAISDNHKAKDWCKWSCLMMEHYISIQRSHFFIYYRSFRNNKQQSISFKIMTIIVWRMQFIALSRSWKLME